MRQSLPWHPLRDVRFNLDGLFKQALAHQELLRVVMVHVAPPVYSVLQMRTTRLMLAAQPVSQNVHSLCFVRHVDALIDSACRGSIEGNPKCADSSWSLWKGFQGNGFCCQVGLNGVYNSGNTVAGTCVSGAPPAGYTTAVIVSSSKAQLQNRLKSPFRCQQGPAAQPPPLQRLLRLTLHRLLLPDLRQQRQ